MTSLTVEIAQSINGLVVIILVIVNNESSQFDSQKYFSRNPGPE